MIERRTVDGGIQLVEYGPEHQPAGILTGTR